MRLIGFCFLKNEKSHPSIHGEGQTEGQTILCCLKAKVKVVSQNNELIFFSHSYRINGFYNNYPSFTHLWCYTKKIELDFGP